MTINIILALSIGFIGGVFISFYYLFLSAKHFIFRENTAKAGFDTTVNALVKGFEDKHWKIPVIHDMKETMRKNGKTDVLNAKVLEICQPELSHKILSRDKERIAISMMPCRIAVYEKADGSVIISRMNASLLGKFMPGIIPEVMKSAASESEEIIEATNK